MASSKAAKGAGRGGGAGAGEAARAPRPREGEAAAKATRAARPPAGRVAAAGATGRTQGAARGAVARRLLELPEPYAAPPDASVVTILHEARALEAILSKYGRDLLRGTKLGKTTPAELGRRRQVLEDAERAWLAPRESAAPRSVARLRRDSEGLVRDVTAAVRYFLEHDEDVQRHVEDIREGAGDADRIADLERCAGLLEGHAEALRKADLPKKASKLCRDLARELAGAAAERTPGAGDVAREQGLRNRAYWHLRELIDQIRAAGRYVFRHEPERLVLFRTAGAKGHRGSRRPSSVKLRTRRRRAPGAIGGRPDAAAPGRGGRRRPTR